MQIKHPKIPHGKYGCFPPEMRELLLELDKLTGMDSGQKNI